MKQSSSLLILITFILTAVYGQCAEKPVHVFILSGQSNMAGMNPASGFVPETKKLFADAEVLYFKVARGGQPIRLWVEEWNNIAGKHNLKARINNTTYYKPILEQFARITKGHPSPKSVTFCWMQGERDAKEQLSAAYTEAMKQLIANLRRDLKQPEMNFVIGRLSDCRNDKSWENVRTSQVNVANSDPRGSWVDCDDLNDKEKNGVKHNDLHYTKEGYALLGRRYARQAKALITGKAPAKNGRPE